MGRSEKKSGNLVVNLKNISFLDILRTKKTGNNLAIKTATIKKGVKNV